MGNLTLIQKGDWTRFGDGSPTVRCRQHALQAILNGLTYQAQQDLIMLAEAERIAAPYVASMEARCALEAE